jgi:hypothetical protein
MRARRSSGGRWALAGVLVVAASASASACATRADEDPLLGAAAADETSDPGGTSETDAASGAGQATARALAQASERSTGEAHRLAVSMSMHASGSRPGEQLDIDAPLMTGEEDGSSFEVHMDMGPLFDQMASSMGPEASGSPVDDVDLTMDMAGDEQTLYIRAPMYAQLAEAAPAGTDLGPVEQLAALGDGWGRVDLAELGNFSLSEVQGSLGGPGGSDPRVILDLVAAADDAHEAEAQQIDGTTVPCTGAQLSMGEMLEAQGMDPEEYSNQIAASLGVGPGTNVDPDELAERYLAIEIPFEVCVDDGGYVRRVSYEVDLLEMVGPGMDGGLGAGGPTEFTMGTTIDYSDYGDESISIDFPPDAADVTEAYRNVLEASAAEAAAAAGNPVGS